MGLFGFVGDVLAAPVKIASIPVRLTERAIVGEDYERPFTDAFDDIADAIEDALDELDD